MRRTAKVMVAALVVLPTLLTQNPPTLCLTIHIHDAPRIPAAPAAPQIAVSQPFNRDKRLPGEDLNDDTDLISERSTYSASCSGCSRIV